MAASWLAGSDSWMDFGRGESKEYPIDIYYEKFYSLESMKEIPFPLNN